MTGTSQLPDRGSGTSGAEEQLWHSFCIDEIRDDRGAILVFPDRAHLPHEFDMNRVYFLFTESEAAVRGNHAHKRLWQVAMCLTGSVTIDLDDGRSTESFRLDSPKEALLIGPVWRRLHSFTQGTICAILASEAYDPEDYLRSYDAFLAYVADRDEQSSA